MASKEDVPSYDQLINPTLQALHKLGGSASIYELADEIIADLQLPVEVSVRGSTRPGLAGGRWVDRPAEGRPSTGGGRGEATLEQDILRLVRGDTGGRRFGRGGRGLFPTRSEDASMAEPGTYTVILMIGDETFTQSLQVERSATAPSG